MKRKTIQISIVGISLCGLLAACTDGKTTQEETRKPEPTGTPALGYTVITTYPHDTNAFTEGLQFYNGKLYESTGSPENMPQTRSVIGEVNLQTGQLQKKVELDRKKYFGEGMVFLHQKLYQLTYTSQIGFIYDATTFKQTGTFTFSNKEGWGLTTDGTHLIMSDGTQTLTYLDTVSLKPVRTLTVSDERGAVTNLNELEYVQGFIYANIYTSAYIVKIDPQTGKVVGRLDLSSLQQDAMYRNPNALEMNGIAYDSSRGSLYITGKMWPTIYEISVYQTTL